MTRESNVQERRAFALAAGWSIEISAGGENYAVLNPHGARQGDLFKSLDAAWDFAAVMSGWRASKEVINRVRSTPIQRNYRGKL